MTTVDEHKDLLRRLRLLAVGILLLALAAAAVGALAALSILHHEPPSWTGVPAGLGISFGLVFITAAVAA